MEREHIRVFIRRKNQDEKKRNDDLAFLDVSKFSFLKVYFSFNYISNHCK